MNGPGFALPRPGVAARLDPLFRPAPLARRAFEQLARQTGHPVRVRFALEQSRGAVSHFATELVPETDPAAAANFPMLERLVKLALWAHGGYRIHLDAPATLVEQLRAHFHDSTTGRFDSHIVGRGVYDDHPIEVIATRDLPPERQATTALGRHLDGCRIGFDLGGSDRKVAAVIDGRVVFSEETEWDPYYQPDPQYHWDGIMDSLRRAADHLPRVDAIGGSAAGVYVDNQVKFASLFRGVAPELFESRVRNMFRELRHAWHDVPFDVANDGDVTALLGSMSVQGGGVLGIALGTSTAGGYVTADAHITPWLNEIAFVPVDYRSDAPIDEWSGDRGCIVQYLSQQAVGRLLAPAEIYLPPSLPLPEKLKAVQALMQIGDARAHDIYQTVGVYLGYALAQLATVYDFRHVLVLGRVTSGPGGDVMLDVAREVLATDFPELASRLDLRMPGEQEKRHGQAIAAASLPDRGETAILHG
ncbi:MAG TPA: ROK family protein [Polyangia bacterium]|nr:ROK family protein [Polyangia bacterium]